MKRELDFVKSILLLVVALLLPVGALAGSLEPSGAPAPTMRTLEEQKPAWNKIIPGAQRFVDALDGTAVLDKETGLVWAKTPDATTRTWESAVDYCRYLTLGGRKGWRLPSLEELESLLDMTQSSPALPSDHPFPAVPGSFVWTSTFNVVDDYFAVGFAGGVVGSATRSSSFNVWPVRGGK